jgi:hypothetical protein
MGRPYNKTVAVSNCEPRFNGYFSRYFSGIAHMPAYKVESYIVRPVQNGIKKNFEKNFYDNKIKFRALPGS